MAGCFSREVAGHTTYLLAGHFVPETGLPEGGDGGAVGRRLGGGGLAARRPRRLPGSGQHRRGGGGTCRAVGRARRVAGGRCRRVPVRALLLVTELVVVGAEPAAAEATGVGLLTCNSECDNKVKFELHLQNKSVNLFCRT